jgi:hypothetical protein
MPPKVCIEMGHFALGTLPFVMNLMAVATDGFTLSRFGPVVPWAFTAFSVWQF